MEFTRHICRDCGGVAHPASGCQYTPTYIVCGRCIRQVITYVVETTNSKGRRKGRPAFYDHVNRISPPIFINPSDGHEGEAELVSPTSG